MSESDIAQSNENKTHQQEKNTDFFVHKLQTSVRRDNSYTQKKTLLLLQNSSYRRFAVTQITVSHIANNDGRSWRKRLRLGGFREIPCLSFSTIYLNC